MKRYAIIILSILFLFTQRVKADSWAQFCWDAAGLDPLDPGESLCKNQDFYVRIHYEKGDAAYAWRWRVHGSTWSVSSPCLSGDDGYDEVVGPFNTDLNEVRVWIIAYDSICDFGIEALYTEARTLEKCAWTPTPTPTITQTPTEAPTGVIPTSTHSPVPTVTPTYTVTLTPTPTGSATPTITATPTETVTPSVTPTITETPTPTPSCTNGPTSTPWDCLGEQDNLDGPFLLWSTPCESGKGSSFVMADSEFMLQGAGSLRIQTEEYSQCLTSRAFNVVPGHSYRVGFYASTSDAENNYLIYGATDALCNAADFCVPTDWLTDWEGWTLTGTWFYRVFDVTPERSVMVVFLGGETGASSIWYDGLNVVDLDGEICTPTPTWTPLFTRTPTPTATSHPIDPMNEMKYQPWHDWILRGIF